MKEATCYYQVYPFDKGYLAKEALLSYNWFNL